MIVLAALLALATPAPSPSPLLTITTVESSAVCTVLHSTVIPVAFIERKNEQAMDAMRAGRQRLASSSGAWKIDFDMEAHREQYYTGVVWSNINLAESLIRESEARYPSASFPDVAAIREKAEAVLDAQRRRNSGIDSRSGAYLDQTSGPGAPSGAGFASAAGEFLDAARARTGSSLEQREAAFARVTIAAYRMCRGLPGITPAGTAPHP